MQRVKFNKCQIMYIIMAFSPMSSLVRSEWYFNSTTQYCCSIWHTVQRCDLIFRVSAGHPAYKDL